MHGRKYCGRMQLAYVPERIFKNPLLDRHLGRRLQMLHGATAAYAEIRTGGLHPLRGWLDYPFQPGGIEAWLLPHDARQHFFARQGAVDKHNLALAARKDRKSTRLNSST